MPTPEDQEGLQDMDDIDTEASVPDPELVTFNPFDVKED